MRDVSPAVVARERGREGRFVRSDSDIENIERARAYVMRVIVPEYNKA